MSKYTTAFAAMKSLKRNMSYQQQTKKSRIYIWIISTIIISTAFIDIALIRGSRSLQFSLFSFDSISTSSYPTSIPWINNKSECEYTNRNWRDGKCWDSEHNPMF